MKNKTYKCEKCGHNFTFAWNLKQHLKHNRICGTQQENFKCTNCNKNFTLRSTLSNHFARCIVEDPYRFSCPFCERKFTFSSSLRKHINKNRCPKLNTETIEIEVMRLKLETPEIDEEPSDNCELDGEMKLEYVEINEIESIDGTEIKEKTIAAD